MAEEQKPVVELPTELVAPAAVVEAPTATETAPALAAEDKPAEEAKAVEAEPKTEEPAPLQPVEEGHLAHKAQGASFPKNLIPSKEFFFFGQDAVDAKALAAYLRGEKNTEHAHHNIAWASHTGKGLLFIGDKTAPSSVINLAEATEPENDGSNKFHLTHKGAKHSFKAVSTAERDNWVAQLKLKIAEAKELAASVTESETYKNVLGSLKPAPKEEEPKADDAVRTEESPAVEGETAAAAAAADDGKPVEESKRRSASRKRTSIFGFVKKESTKEKKEEAKSEEPAATEPAAADAEPVDVDVAEGEAPPAAVAVDDKATEEKALESPKEKPSASKRNSFFGGVFSKKEKKPAEVKPAEEPAKEAEAADAAAAAPVIPPVDASTPLSAEEVNAAAENAEVTPANGAEPAAKKDVKERRKSSLPFAFGRREKSPAPADGEEKTEKSEKRQSQSPFSKLRATIKGKTTPKSEEKPAEEAVKETTAETSTEEPAAAAAAEPEAESKPENVASATPAVIAAA
ncbi:uncharacterized protein UV8b_02672 [Ustilaginoidea virens]|uniref:Meiotic expression up-regulated protein 6 PH domain-containing protein n=1 Tax=Ustilaginoidea virens TaxID=1159556 RepID=A0A063C5A7_USTVR|nr:uncharacterized protein UV8b_02672 [Ustilaginoidea virens]QUC18431.1 hypothetical protein UV8b_02672 [Ustilaginoidea virens]GAO14457.1 hypothetical protein UVI_02031510 [Ustilaginoidea virens]